MPELKRPSMNPRWLKMKYPRFTIGGYLMLGAAVLLGLIMRVPPHTSPLCHFLQVDCADGPGMVTGKADARFMRVREAFEDLFSKGHEVGAQFVVVQHGEVVVDLQGGTMGADALAVVFSSSKVVESLVVAMLVDRDLLSLDSPVAKYWPEFAQEGKGGITVQELMQHAAALPVLDQALDVASNLCSSPEELDALLARQKPTAMPSSRPGRVSAYHALTRGLFVDALLRRTDGRNIAQFVHEEVVSRLSPGHEFYFGTSHYAQQGSERVRERVVDHVGPPLWSMLAHVLPQLVAPSIRHFLYDDYAVLEDYDISFMNAMLFNESSIQRRAVQLLKEGSPYRGAHDMANDKDYRSLILASANGVTNARTLAAIGTHLASGGGAFLSPSAFEKCTVHEEFHDIVIGRAFNFSAVGWGVDRLKTPLLQRNYGWFGAGGSGVLFNPQHNLSIAYVPAYLAPRLTKPRMQRLMNALDASLSDSRFGYVV